MDYLVRMGAVAIEVHDLKKSYGDLQAVAGIDVQVGEGEVFSLLGPNGAGKTTTVEILEGYRERTSGDVNVIGYDPARGERDFKQRIGIVLQRTGVEPYLTVEEVIELHRGYYPSPRPLDEIIEVVELTAKRKSRVGKLSGGQQRRLDVAVGLAGDPQLLFLDEPTTGFDPSARRNAWAMVKNLQALGKTVFLTTHYMDEAQNLADRAAIIVGGRIVAEGPPETLGGRAEASTKVTFRLPPDAPPLPEHLRPDVSSSRGVELEAAEPMKALHDLTGWALDHNVELESLSVARPSLEDVYLRLTGEPSDAAGGPAEAERAKRR
ncbi:MAG: ABC transporter ATP-binding protein [Actinomycetota bacterium]|nr:ABC transporter ATP-binding protein [Actinomycetota bacterium]